MSLTYVSEPRKRLHSNCHTFVGQAGSAPRYVEVFNSRIAKAYRRQALGANISSRAHLSDQSYKLCWEGVPDHTGLQCAWRIAVPGPQCSCSPKGLFPAGSPSSGPGHRDLKHIFGRRTSYRIYCGTQKFLAAGHGFFSSAESLRTFIGELATPAQVQDFKSWRGGNASHPVRKA